MAAKKPLTAHASIRERFQSSLANLKAHQDMVDNDSFDRGADGALADLTTEIVGGIVDSNSAMAAGYRLKGAVEFLRRFKTFAEISEPVKPAPVFAPLKSTDQPRRP